MKIWDYYIPNNGKHEGWGKFIRDSTGYFSCVTDYGNYAFWWTAHGDGDFRDFLASVDGGYLMGKLSNGQRKFDLEETIKNMKRSAIDSRRATVRGYAYENYEVTKEEIRDIWDDIDGASSEHECTKLIEDHYRCFPDPCGILSYGYPYELRHFATRLWPRFIEALKADTSPRVCKEPRVEA
jgi:hypothetical protein